MREQDPKRICQVFPAFLGGPPELYEDRPRFDRTLRMDETIPGDPDGGFLHPPKQPSPPKLRARTPVPQHARRRNRCIYMPQFDQMELERRVMIEPMHVTPAPAPALRKHPRREREASAPRLRAYESWDSPLYIGLALAFLPPLGVTLLWSSRRMPSEGKIAATVVTAFLCAVCAVLFIASR